MAVAGTEVRKYEHQTVHGEFYAVRTDGQIVEIEWACGDRVGLWNLDEFGDLLKNISKATGGYLYRADIPGRGKYGLCVDADGIIEYGEYVTGLAWGPSLPELKKALKQIKKEVKKTSTT